MHTNLHKPDFNFECSYCLKKFKLKKYLNRHLETHTKMSAKQATDGEDYDEMEMNEQSMDGEESMMDAEDQPLEIIVKEEEMPVQVIVEEGEITGL